MSMAVSCHGEGGGVEGALRNRRQDRHNTTRVLGAIVIASLNCSTLDFMNN
jgi:hypothetical protein